MDEITPKRARSAAILAIKLWVFGSALRIPRGVEPSMILHLGIVNTKFPKENFSWAISKSLPLIQQGSGSNFTTNGQVVDFGNGLHSISDGTWSIEWIKTKSGVLATHLMATPYITAEDIEEVLEILGE